MPKMELRDLFRDVVPEGAAAFLPAGRAVSRLTCVSGEAAHDSAFFALKGVKRDGYDHINEAVSKGCRVVVVERPFKAPDGVAVVEVVDGRSAMALCAGNLYGHPDKALTLAGVTGTSGKTTVSWLLDGILKGSGPSVLLGTIRHLVAGRTVESGNTTPESYDIHAMLREALEHGSRHAVLEVSSHALKLKRVSGIEFSAAVFTNLSRDHMDFHPTETDYLETKLALFSERLKKDGVGAVNLDDPKAGVFLERCAGRVLTFSMEKRDADVVPEFIENRRDGMAIELRTPLGAVSMVTSLKGPFNVSNIMAAVAAGIGLSCGKDAIVRGIEGVKGVDGRFQSVDAGQPFNVIVDYAHKPDALEKVLKAARKITEGRLIAVFGCGGDRDKGKRPLMASVAETMADNVIVTSDNPRTEDPGTIIGEITAGFKDKRMVMVIADRAAAIHEAVGMAGSGDTVIIAGKGHETYQIIGDRKHHFDDRETALDALKGRYGASS